MPPVPKQGISTSSSLPVPCGEARGRTETQSKQQRPLLADLKAVIQAADLAAIVCLIAQLVECNWLWQQAHWCRLLGKIPNFFMIQGVLHPVSKLQSRGRLLLFHKLHQGLRRSMTLANKHLWPSDAPEQISRFGTLMQAQLPGGQHAEPSFLGYIEILFPQPLV